MLGIAFEGCACRAAFHAGVAAGLTEAGLRFPLAAGSSSGSLCAAAVAAGRAAELPGLFLRLAGQKLVSLRRLWWNRSPFDMSHIVRSALHGAFGAAADLRHGPGEALITATRLPDLRRLVFSSRREPDFIAPLLGSCFFPVLYGRPVRVRGALLLDGGLTDNLPLEVLQRGGATDILAVVTSPSATAVKTPLRPRWRPRLAGARLHVLHPRHRLPLRSWDFDPDGMARAVEAGYRCAREWAGR